MFCLRSVRPCVRPVGAAHEPLAIMPSAKTGPDQKHALEALWRKWVFPFSGFDRWCITSRLPFPNSARRSAGLRLRRSAAGSLYRSPLIIMAQIILAILLASATAAILAGRRASNAPAMAAWFHASGRSG